MNDAKIDYVIERAEALIAAHPGMPVACLGLAFKANIDDFRESPALKVAARARAPLRRALRVVEPYAERPARRVRRHRRRLIDIDTAIETCPIMVVLVDHDVFKSVPLDERADKIVYDTRGIWPDQPRATSRPEPLRLAG